MEFIIAHPSIYSLFFLVKRGVRKKITENLQVSENLRTFARSTIGDGIEKIVVYLQKSHYLY